MPLHHNNKQFMVFSLYGFPLIYGVQCVAIMCWCDAFGLLITFFFHIKFVGNYVSIFSFNVYVNQLKENNFNVHECTKSIHPPLSLVMFPSLAWMKFLDLNLPS